MNTDPLLKEIVSLDQILEMLKTDQAEKDQNVEDFLTDDGPHYEEWGYQMQD